MERFKVGSDVAFAMLVRVSSDTNVKLRLVCDQLCQTGIIGARSTTVPTARWKGRSGSGSSVRSGSAVARPQEGEIVNQPLSPDDRSRTMQPEAANSHASSAGDESSATAEQEDADLAAGVAGLAHLSSGRVGLVEMLTQVAQMAVQAVPGADGVGLTLLEPDRDDVTVKTAEFVRQVDDIQYSLGQGPCISAANLGRAIRSGSLGGDPRWPRFGPRAGRLGVHSVLSLPLTTPSGVIGAMNVYARARDAFDDRAEQMGQVFAVPAAISILNAQILAQSQRLAQQLQTALRTRPVIDQACDSSN